MSLLNTWSLLLGDSEAAVVPRLGGSGLPPSPVLEQHAGVERGGKNMAHLYIQIVMLECDILQKSRALCQLPFNKIYNHVILSLSFAISFALMHLQRNFIVRTHGEDCDLF